MSLARVAGIVVAGAVAFSCAAGDGARGTVAPEQPRPGESALASALVGRRAPGFTVPIFGSSQPAAADLAELTGHVVLVDFWATWCAPCIAVVPRLNELQQRYGPDGLRVIGLSSDAPDEVARFASGHGVSYTLASDAGDKVAATYQVSGLPMLVLIDRAGIVRYVDVGGRDWSAAGGGQSGLEAAVAAVMR